MRSVIDNGPVEEPRLRSIGIVRHVGSSQKGKAMPKTVAKQNKAKKPSRKASARPKDWRDAIRLYLSKVPTVDAVFVNTANGTVHVYSVVREHRERHVKGLLRQEDVIEQAFPEMSFEFHTWVHQGRQPSQSGPPFSELVYLR